MRKPAQLQLKRARVPPRQRQRGVSLIDGLIAIAILSFGLIGLTRMQGRMVMAATDAQFRTTAIQFADEILNTALIDNANAACYTLPATGSCSSATATATTTAWSDRVAAAFPVSGTVESTVTLGVTGPGQMTVTISWTPRDRPTDDERRELRVTTDVR